MTPSAEITRTTHLTQFRGVYFGLKNQCKIVLNIVKKKIMVHDANKNIEKTQTIVLHVVIKKKLETSFQNGPEYNTTSFRVNMVDFSKIFVC